MDKIDLFSDIYPEEDYRSIISRHHKLSANETLNKTNHQLFNKNSAKIGLIPNNLNWLISKVYDARKVQIENLPYKNTLVSLVISFLNKSQIEKLKNYMFNGYTVNPVATLLRKFISNNIRFCLMCNAEDYDNIGVNYIHRLHQLNSLSLCYKHFVPLVESGNSITKVDIQSLKGNDLSLEYINFEKNLIIDIIYLLNHLTNSELIYNKFISIFGIKRVYLKKGRNIQDRINFRFY
ncbi:hypothetical protein GC098_31210 [Paenibacillus sp. LMG 31458]|uniref:TniQ domain-containing protein n=1 Tax=Paenibacillus phytorum TaxID=2654977 RepID=A0ABX1Y4F9_9BACL|nr:TniQ family protein [Paenibacillus phytorum]NOU75780.1 hypothetical protein [Paenibacillus phytorum]